MFTVLPKKLMQSYALTVDKFLDHAAKWSGNREVVTAEAGGLVSRIDYAALRTRSNRLSGALCVFRAEVRRPDRER